MRVSSLFFGLLVHCKKCFMVISLSTKQKCTTEIKQTMTTSNHIHIITQLNAYKNNISHSSKSIWIHNTGIQTKLKDLARTFMMISNRKKNICSQWFIHPFFSALSVKQFYLPGPVFSYKLRYIVGFWLVEMAISTNQKPTTYRNLYENTAPGLLVW